MRHKQTMADQTTELWLTKHDGRDTWHKALVSVRQTAAGSRAAGRRICPLGHLDAEDWESGKNEREKRTNTITIASNGPTQKMNSLLHQVTQLSAVQITGKKLKFNIASRTINKTTLVSAERIQN